MPVTDFQKLKQNHAARLLIANVRNSPGKAASKPGGATSFDLLITVLEELVLL